MGRSYAEIEYDLGLRYGMNESKIEKLKIETTKTKKMGKMGAPKKTTSILPSHWQNTLLELYSQGASDKEVKALIHSWLGKFSNNLWDRWMKEEEDFWETIKKGRLFSEVWWEKQGRMNLSNKNFKTTLWYVNMRNRFGWSNKRRVKSE